MSRSAVVALAALLAAATPAAARQGGEPFTDLMNMSTHSIPAHQAAATMMAPSFRLPSSAPKWIAAQAARQAASPRRVAQVALDIDRDLTRDIRRASRQQGVDPDEMISAILLGVMFQAHAILERQFPGEAARQPDAAVRLATAQANLENVLPLQSQISLRLAVAQ